MKNDFKPAGQYRAVAFGASAGGFDPLFEILSCLPEQFNAPIFIAQHLHYSDDGRFAEHLARATGRVVIDPCDKQPIEPGRIYVAPANYHLLVEQSATIALSTDEKVNWSRPSIDALFESAARVYGEGLIAVILSGANNDGARGMKKVRELGGLAIAQAPETAEHSVMPQSAIEMAGIEFILSPRKIGELLRDCFFRALEIPDDITLRRSI